MRIRLIVGLMLLVVAPLAALGVLAVEMVANEKDHLRRQVAQVAQGDLNQTARLLDQLMSDRWNALVDQLPVAGDTAETLRARLGAMPWISSFFIQGADGKLIYPDPNGGLTNSEIAFLARSQQLWSQASLFAKPSEYAAKRPSQGWYPWFHENGLHLLAWSRLEGDMIVGAELDRMRFLADLIAALPSTGSDTDERRVLRDARGEIVYQWGGFEPPNGTPVIASTGLAAPLRGWTIDIFLSHTAFSDRMGEGTRVALLSGVSALAVALIALALFLFRSTEREHRAAQQRVTFVNQVSHELKTPLTNIRLYAELLEGRLDDEQDRARRDLGIIVSESQRLSRLINNVLGFARQGRGQQRLKAQSRTPDEVIELVLGQFAPALERAGVSVNTQLNIGTELMIDADAIGQILANLISNVEKYAAQGERLDLHSQLLGDTVQIQVRDYGPGISAEFRRDLFTPFERADSSLTEGVSGTGIGLALSRELARHHGGDLVCEPSEQGACFTLRFKPLEESA